MNSPDRTRRDDHIPNPHFNLLVAGATAGKTAFLRLLLDTSVVSHRTDKDQLSSVAKFVQGASGPTTYIRGAALEIIVDPADGTGQSQPVNLTLIDSPSLDFADDQHAEHTLADILRHIESRFVEAIDDDRKAKSGDRFVHLYVPLTRSAARLSSNVAIHPHLPSPRLVSRCIYFLDPDQIVPPPVPAPPAPLIPRNRTNSFSQPDHEPVILEPPVTANHARPVLPKEDIAAIRRLSALVNVLPVVSKADILSNDRLAAVKIAIRKDLADAGIGFGIFDTDPPFAHHGQDELAPVNRPESSNGYPPPHPNGASSANLNNTPPTSPTSPSILCLPYALISPDIYAHSDGVVRRLPNRHELVSQYTPSTHYPPSFQLPRGKFTRSYRWGVLDVLDPSHSDFVALRTAIFHHMNTLQKYTQGWLFDKFRVDYTHHQRPSSRHSISHLAQQMAPIPPHASRPILAIDTHPPPMPLQHRHPLQVQRDVYPPDLRSAPPRQMPETPLPSAASVKGPVTRPKQRTKKITVACNFCRSRKLKCDGGRPACGQCLKRSHACDYMPQNKRRGTQRQRKQDGESESESGDERSAEADEPSASPEVTHQQPLSRRSSTVGKPPILQANEDYNTPTTSLPSLSSALHNGGAASSSAASGSHPHAQHAPHGHSHSPSASLSSRGGGGGKETNSRTFFPDHDVPPIATLPVSETSPSTPAPMSAPTLPPIRPASEQQAAQRKRAMTVPGKSLRQPTSSGPKVVACNFCRARKTKCDGVHPACGSCARRQLDCNYVHDASGGSASAAHASASNGNGNGNGNGGLKKNRRTSSATAASLPSHLGGKHPDDSPQSLSPPSSRMIATPLTGNNEGPSSSSGAGGPLMLLTSAAVGVAAAAGGKDHVIKDEMMAVDLKRQQMDYPPDGLARAAKKMRLEEASQGLPIP